MIQRRNISRRLSIRDVIQAIITSGPISRAQLAKQTNLSKQTVSEIVAHLEKEGWVHQVGRTHGHIGRTAVTYELIENAAFIASVDLGGTKVRVALADLACTIINTQQEPTAPEGGEVVINQIARLIRQAALAAGIAPNKVKLVVVGVPGVPDQNTGHVVLAVNIKGFDDIDVISALHDALGIEVILENDVNLAVLGEHAVSQDCDNLVYISIGTGIGAGIINNGQLLKGAHNAAGELGYLPLGSDPFEEKSRHTGALERAIGTEGICARYRAMGGDKATVPEIFAAYQKGEVIAIRTLDKTANLIAQSITAVCAVLNPQEILLGGSIGMRIELFEQVQKHLSACCPYPVTLKISQLGTQAALLGGAHVGLAVFHNLVFEEGMAGLDTSSLTRHAYNLKATP